MTVPVPAGAGGVDRAGEAEAVEAVARKHFGGAVWDEASWAVQQRCRREAAKVVAAAYPVIAAAVRAEERGRALIRTESRDDGSVIEVRTTAVEVSPATRCAHDCGSRPSWMSPGQYDPCRCVMGPNHDGREHKCVHNVDDHAKANAAARVPE